ncbi:MAG: glycosyltransferase [Elusimicrobiota bacterium]
MKVLYLDTPIEPPGGGQISLLLILKHLDRSKYDPVVFVPGRSSYTNLLEAENIPCRVVPLRGLFSAIKKFMPSIVHCNAPVKKYAFAAALISKLLGIPFVWHVRVIHPHGWRDRLIASLSARIIVISDAVGEQLSRERQKDKIIKIYNAVDTETFKPGIDTGELRKGLNIENGKMVVGMFSRFDSWKGHSLFLEAAKIVKENINNVVFLIAGDGPEKNNIETKIRDLGLTGDVIIAGFRKDVPQLMSICDIVVNPSIQPEPFGRIIIEAMACGKAVISTNTGGPIEIIENNRDGFLVKPNALELSGILLKVLGDEKLRNIAGENARIKIKEKFDTGKQMQELEKLYGVIARPLPRKLYPEGFINQLKTDIENACGKKIIKFSARGKRIMKINLAFSDYTEKTVVVKPVPGKKAPEIFGLMVRLGDIFNQENGFITENPVCYSSDFNYVATEVIKDASQFRDALVKYARPIFPPYGRIHVQQLIQKCAEWLLIFQNKTPQKTKLPGGELFLTDDRVIQNDLFNLEKMGMPAKAVNIFRTYFKKNLPGIRKMSFDVTGCHGDFGPRNILINKQNKICIVDFENFDYRTIYDDPATFLVCMDMFKLKRPFVDYKKIKELKRIFLQAYASESVVNDDLLSFFEIRYFVHITGNEFAFNAGRPPVLKRIFFRRIINYTTKWILSNEKLRNQ